MGGVVLHRREWGAGQPVITMHPLGLESSAFEGFGAVLARAGMQTIAVDLPGFGRTPIPDRPLTPAAMAEPVIELARSLATPPIVLGISMGGRVALEAALLAPEAFRGAVAIAPYLPWLRFRPFLEAARLIDPRVADWMPFERAWPVLRWLAHALETLPYLRDDQLAQAGARLVYFMSCPATRAGFIAAARELALDPAHGAQGLWTRLPDIAVPTAFVWGERDQLVSLRFSHAVARACPDVPQVLLPCTGHWVNGPHHRCLAEAVAGLVTGMLEGAVLEADREHKSGVRFVTRPCIAEGAPARVPVFEVNGHGA
jgi:pimeloyl-ACP methyl ester carboxylesterase